MALLSRTTILLAASAMLLIALGGCGSVPETHYYTIGRILPEAPAGSPKAAITVGVPQFEAEGIYERDNLLFRRGNYELAVDYYRRWGLPPQTMLAEATLDYVRQAGLFSSVLRMPTMASYDAVLAGRIIRFEEAAGEIQVVLEYSLEVARGHKILWRHEVSSSAPVALEASAEARVSATEQCIRDCLEQLTEALSSASISFE